MEDNRAVGCTEQDAKCSASTEEKLQRLIALEDQNAESLVLAGCISCPGPRNRDVHGIPTQRCRRDVALPRFSDDDANQAARDIWPNMPHRELPPEERAQKAEERFGRLGKYVKNVIDSVNVRE